MHRAAEGCIEQFEEVSHWNAPEVLKGTLGNPTSPSEYFKKSEAILSNPKERKGFADPLGFPGA